MTVILDKDIRFIILFWIALLEKMEMKLKRSTTLHPHIDGKTEVVNKTFNQLLRSYNHQHPKAWDENCIYIQHSYNRAIHTSTGKSPFKTYFRYSLLSPLDFVYG